MSIGADSGLCCCLGRQRVWIRVREWWRGLEEMKCNDGLRRVQQYVRAHSTPAPIAEEPDTHGIMHCAMEPPSLTGCIMTLASSNRCPRVYELSFFFFKQKTAYEITV